MAKLPFEARRWIVIVAGVPFLAVILNWAVGWGWFGANDRTAADVAFLFLIILAFFVAPPPAEIRRNNAARMLRERRKKP